MYLPFAGGRTCCLYLPTCRCDEQSTAAQDNGGGASSEQSILWQRPIPECCGHWVSRVCVVMKLAVLMVDGGGGLFGDVGQGFGDSGELPRSAGAEPRRREARHSHPPCHQPHPSNKHSHGKTARGRLSAVVSANISLVIHLLSLFLPFNYNNGRRNAALGGGHLQAQLARRLLDCRRWQGMGLDRVRS